ncbi:MAG TPA: PAS domain S-box protein, partial [Phycisphaerales bacterium]|nr:PAS domain S-box protein [Phycisphaerales bacterium]
MTSRMEPQAAPSITRILPIAVGGLAALQGGITLCLWLTGYIGQLSAQGFITPKTNMALCQMLTGLGLVFLFNHPKKTGSRIWIGITLAAIVTIIAGLTLIQHIARVNLGIDELLAKEVDDAVGTNSPNRMGLPGSSSLFLLGIALLLHVLRPSRLVPWMALGVLVINLIPAVGFILGSAELYTGYTTGTAWPTVLILSLCAVGLIAATPEFDPMALMLRDDAGGRMMRAMLLPAILIPILLGLFRALAGTLFGLPVDAVRGIPIIGMCIVLCALVWRSARRFSMFEAEQRSTQTELRGTELRFAKFMRNLPGLAWIKDSKGRYVFVNDAAEKAFGRTRNDLYNRGDEDLFPVETAERFRQNDRHAMESGSGVQVVETMFQNDRTHYSLVNKFPIHDAEGNVSFIGGIAIDITDRVEAERDVQEMAQKYHHLVERLPAAVYTTDSSGRITLYNAAAVALWGGAPEIGVDRWCNSARILSSDGVELPLDQCPMAEAIRLGRAGVGREIILERPDGSRRHVLPMPEPIVDEHGNVLGAVNMLTDITDRKQAEETRMLLASIVSTSNDAILSIDMQMCVTSWNRAAERLYGYTAEEMIGQSVRILIPEQRQQEESDFLDALQSGRVIEHFETVRVAKNGKHIDVLITVSPIFDGQGRLVGASKVTLDITERKRVSAELASTKENLAQQVLKLKEETRLLETLNSVNQTLAAELDQDKLVQTVTDAGRALTGAQFGAFF